MQSLVTGNNIGKKIFIPILFYILVCGINSYGQIGAYSAGINLGISSYESLSTPVSGIHLSAFYEFPAWFTKAINFQASVFYLRKTEFFLPEDSEGKYYPYFYGASFSGIMRQRIRADFFIEEQAGILIFKNKFFSDLEETNYGVCFGVSGGIDLRGIETKGFLIGLGYKGALTFNGNTPSFNTFQIQTQYFF